MKTNHILKLGDFKRPSTQIKPSAILNPPSSIDLISQDHEHSKFFRKLEDKGILLNQDQINVLLSTSPHNIINALAGSGKTSVLVALVAYKLYFEALKPQSLLILAYSKRAAGELKDRFKNILPDSNINPMTLHGFCYQLLRFNGYKNWSLLTDDLQRQSVFRLYIRKRHLPEHYTAEYVASSLSYHVNCCKELTDPILQSLRHDYESYKEERKLLDFDDILLKAYELLLSDEQLLSRVKDQFKCVIVDEFQDLNMLQFSIISLLIDNNGESFFFGDRHQSIFSFRGSTPNLIDDATYNLNDTSHLTLNVNYRSTNTILGLGNYILASMGPINTKLLTGTVDSNITPAFYRPLDSTEEAHQILALIRSKIAADNLSFKDFAILYRSASVANSVFEILLTNRVPITSPAPFPLLFENEKIRIIIAHLRLVCCPYNINAVLDLSSTLYISALRIKQHFADFKSTPSQNCLLSMADMSDLEDYQVKLIINRLLLIDQIKALPPKDAIRTIVDHAEVKRHLLSTNHENEDPTKELIDDLKDTSATFNSIEAFILHIDSLQLQKKSMQKQQETDAVTLSTIHTAKGLEWPVVFLIGCIDGILPHHSSFDPIAKSVFSPIELNTTSVEEEKRLLYVGVTRAKQELHIFAPKNHHNSPSKASRFLEAFFNATN